MPRIRTIKPSFFRHEALQDLERANPGACAMLVFAGLWTQADCEGRFRYRPRQLKLDILPFLEFDIGATMEILARAGFVQLYDSDGERFGVIPTFPDHQRISGSEAKEVSKLPTPPDRRRSELETPAKQVGSSPETPAKQVGTLEGNGVRSTEDGVRSNQERTAPAASRRLQEPDSPEPGDPEPEPPERLLKRKPRPIKPPSEKAKFPHYPTELCQRLHAKWEAKIGLIPYPVFRSRTAEPFNRPGFAESETLEVWEETIVLFSIYRDIEPERERKWFTPERWWADFPRLLHLAHMPMTEGGIPTEKGVLVLS